MNNAAVTWVADTFVDPDKPIMSAHSPALMWGYGVFETLYLAPTGPIALPEHLTRLSSAAQKIGLAAPDLAQIATAVTAVSDKYANHGRLRIAWLAQPAGKNPLLVITAAALPAPSTTLTVTRSPYMLNENSPTTGLKTTAYLDNVLHRRTATAAGADEVLLTNTRGDLCEASMANVFVVRSGQLSTPDAAAGPLLGITRQKVLEYAARTQLPASERAIPWAEVLVADALILTSALRGAQLVHALDEQVLQTPDWVTTWCAAFNRDYFTTTDAPA